MKKALLFIIVACLVIGCAGSGSASRTTAPVTTSAADAALFLQTAPEDSGFDPAVLETLFAEIKSGRWVDVHGLVIFKDGNLVAEGYWNGWNKDRRHDLRSASKSIASILVGIAVDRGHIASVHTPVYNFFPEYRPSRYREEWLPELTIEHLLNMTSGFEFDDWFQNFRGERDISKSRDWIRFAATAAHLRRPGTFYAYNTASMVLLSGIISRSSGEKMTDFAGSALFGPLGIHDWRWRNQKGVVYMGGNLELTCRDMAKIGLLMLKRGEWNGERVLSAQWVEESFRELGIHEPSFQRHGFYHHYMWWRFERDFHGTLVRGYYASGNGGQNITVIPDLNMVVALTAGNYDKGLDDQPVRIILDRILPALLAGW